MRTISVNNHTYEMSDELAAKNVEVAREATAGRVCIFALEKGISIEMRRDIFSSKRALMTAVAKFTKAGFLVHFHTGEANAS